MAKKIQSPKHYRDLPAGIVKQMLLLATSGFGLVAALAWNEVIKEIVNNYIRPYFPKDSSIITLFIYAIIITVVAVIITFHLTSLSERLGSKKTKIKKTK